VPNQATIGQRKLDQKIITHRLRPTSSVSGWNKEAMIGLRVNQLLNLFFNMPKIKNHALIIELAAQFYINDPGLPHHTTIGIKVREIHHCKVVYK
jgi:hypothetical protein